MNYFEKILQRTAGRTVPPLSTISYRKKAALPVEEKLAVQEEKPAVNANKKPEAIKSDTTGREVREKNTALPSETPAEKKDFPPTIPESRKATPETNIEKINPVEKYRKSIPDPMVSQTTTPALPKSPALEIEIVEKIVPIQEEHKEKKIQVKNIPVTPKMLPTTLEKPVTNRRQKETPRVVIGKLLIELIKPPAPAPVKTIPAPVRKTNGHTSPAPSFRWEENTGRAGFGLDQF